MMNSKIQHEVICGNYLVAFIDLLGQKDRVKNINFIPPPVGDESYEASIKDISEAVNPIYALQENCDILYNAYIKNIRLGELDDFLKNSHKSHQEVKKQYFSDGIMIYVPINYGKDSSPLKGIIGLFNICGLLTLTGLSLGEPIRMGIALGSGAEVRGDHLHGNPVVEAYRLESEIAQYPRAVVADSVVDHLYDMDEGLEVLSDDENSYGSAIAKLCLNLIAQDVDGLYFIDYLNKSFREGHETLHKGSLEKAYKFVVSQLEKHQAEKNTKLAFRYANLSNYFKDRLGDYDEFIAAKAKPT